MSMVGISEAARLVGRDRKSLYRDIKSGKLTATTGDSGEKRVDVAELIRAYGPLRPVGDSAEVAETVAMPQEATHELQVKVARLEAENEQLKERLTDKDRNIDDLRNAVRLLEHKRQQPVAAAAVPESDSEDGWPWGMIALVVVALALAGYLAWRSFGQP